MDSRSQSHSYGHSCYQILYAFSRFFGISQCKLFGEFKAFEELNVTLCSIDLLEVKSMHALIVKLRFILVVHTDDFG